MANLTKTDMVSAVAKSLKASTSHGNAALNAVLDAIRSALAKGDRVVVTGFGSFTVRSVKERRVRSIRGASAGQTIVVPAHRRVGFHAGTELAKAVRPPRRRR